jgi:predicted dienelactone hydrolase
MKALKRTSIVLAGILAAVLAVLALYLGGAVAYQAAAASPDDPRDDAPAYGGRGPRAVGVREAWTGAAGSDRAGGIEPLRLTVWYPAGAGVDPAAVVAYPYEMKWFARVRGPLRTRGRATRDAPVAQDATGRPVAVLSSGFALPVGGYVWLAERLASHGFVVVAPEHPERMDAALDGFWQGVIDRPAEVAAVLDWIDREAAAGGSLDGLADPGRVAVVGHSLGGTTALELAGARLDLDGFAHLCDEPDWQQGEHAFLCDLVLGDVDAMAGRAGLGTAPRGPWPSRRDDRVDAIVAMASDAFLFGPEGLAGVGVPMLAMGGTADASAPFAWSAGWAYRHASSPRKALAALEGGGHMVFAGSCVAVPVYRALGAGGFCSDPAWEMDRAHDRIAHLVTAFLRAELAGDVDAARALVPEAVASDGVAYRAHGYGLAGVELGPDAR